MTRIDAFSPQERESIKQEIKQEIKRDERRSKMLGCGGCLFAVILAVGIPTAYVASRLAKTGFFDVPLMSRSLYRPTVPERTVLPLVGSKPDDIYRVLGTKVKYDPQTSLATIPVSEAELTTLVQHAVATAPANALPFPIRTIQVAVDPDVIEIYAVSPQKNRDASVRVRFRPYVKGGELRADVGEIAIGSLVLPKKVGDFLFATFGTFVIDAATGAIANVGQLMNIGLDQGVVKFMIVPAAAPH
ncbi:MAG: hypothetical protein RL272_100 [Candidatus Parcubacteria bacterium]|jgi:hypothetical protein